MWRISSHFEIAKPAIVAVVCPPKKEALMATTRKLAIEWMAQALVELVDICNQFIDGDPVEAQANLEKHMREVRLVERATGANLVDAIPRRRRRES